MEPLRADMFEEICPSSLLPFRVGPDKWAALVIRCLEAGPRRYSELRVPLARVSPKALTHSLRALERDGFIRRTEQPRRVTYELTPLGQGLFEQLQLLCDWASDNWDNLLDAREA
ncbi:helix-turn-helix transcriptional regulator [Kribbella sandramycini]|uniref:DNA-binding HxlR family transcriptional regulator n=1 Tax=Kribbella sandramycini TaxID=60450 RepID=A0A7Y4L814_9ACTN|nr:helix-turn-helix domain-containing protein [Kribbella sandramycini]MBB6566025.1 DNA-binding HxlR family transcriptional regulator [Kribbella sandramycini]NOL45026.1 helix-turn-helix transcriptional regulator [Kribbella sandramycini]